MPGGGFALSHRESASQSGRHSLGASASSGSLASWRAMRASVTRHGDLGRRSLSGSRQPCCLLAPGSSQPCASSEEVRAALRHLLCAAACPDATHAAQTASVLLVCVCAGWLVSLRRLRRERHGCSTI